MQNLTPDIARELKDARQAAYEALRIASQYTDTLKPYTATKTAYIGDSEVVFYDVPDGNVSVFIDGRNYSVERIQNRLTVSFDALTEQTDITISII